MRRTLPEPSRKRAFGKPRPNARDDRGIVEGMSATAANGNPRRLREIFGNDHDNRVVMHGMDWWRYEAMLAIRGDEAGPRISYLEGELELMSPSRPHEFIKKAIARIVEAYAEETGLFFNGYGSLTMKNPAAERGAEPDECYIVGRPRDLERDYPNLAIEVIWTSGGIDKRRLYAGLGIAELWEWRDERIDVLVLRGKEYAPAARSGLLPDLDLDLVARLIEHEDQTLAVRELRQSLRR
jgi:Uma2 family endonuclease